MQILVGLVQGESYEQVYLSLVYTLNSIKKMIICCIKTGQGNENEELNNLYLLGFLSSNQQND